MTTRAEQGIATRERIVEAAVDAFSEKGFRGASTREIAQRADTNQGLITYHFRTKDDLWRAAADRIFGMLRTRLSERLAGVDSDNPRERGRAAIREYVRFSAAHPELFRLMVDEGKNSDDRMAWLVDTHLKPRFEEFISAANSPLADEDDSVQAHAYYILAGAGSLIFAVAPECKRLTKIDPTRPEEVEKHADMLARILVP